MDIPRLVSMNEYWAENPPTHLLVKAFMGVKSKTSSNTNVNKESKEENDESLRALVTSMQANEKQSNNSRRVRMI